MLLQLSPMACGLFNILLVHLIFSCSSPGRDQPCLWWKPRSRVYPDLSRWPRGDPRWPMTVQNSVRNLQNPVGDGSVPLYAGAYRCTQQCQQATADPSPCATSAAKPNLLFSPALSEAPATPVAVSCSSPPTRKNPRRCIEGGGILNCKIKYIYCYI